MGKRKAASILQRDKANSNTATNKPKIRKSKHLKAVAAHTPQKHTQEQPQAATDSWHCASVIDRQASQAVGKLLKADASRRGGVSLKSVTLAPYIKEKKATYAVTCQTLKHLPVVQELLKETNLLSAHPKLTAASAYVLVYEVLMGQGCKPNGPAERAVLAAKGPLKTALNNKLASAGVQAVQDLLPDQLKHSSSQRQRSARVNTLKMSVKEALSWLRLPPPEHTKWAQSGKRVHVVDLLPDLLMFPPGTDLHDHPLVLDSGLILQGKSSCMPAHALQPKPGWDVIDACAAPGNKTTHLAALMLGKGKIFAFDKDKRRLELLKANAAAAAAFNIFASQADFLAVDPEAQEYGNVRGMLLDPSCSGSGTAYTRMDHLLPSYQQKLAHQDGHGAEGADASGDDRGRIEQLARFQTLALKHALTFPKLERLVYSTCSIHARENEEVVAAVLHQAQEAGFHLEDPFPAWHRRGLAGTVEGADKLVRTDPELDGTDGFFLAVFARRV